MINLDVKPMWNEKDRDEYGHHKNVTYIYFSSKYAENIHKDVHKLMCVLVICSVTDNLVDAYINCVNMDATLGNGDADLIPNSCIPTYLPCYRERDYRVVNIE